MTDFFNRFQFPLGLAVGVLLAALTLVLKNYIATLIEALVSRLPLSFNRLIGYRLWGRRYRRTTYEDHRYLKFVGVSGSIALHRPKLRDVFVNLELQTIGRVATSAHDQKTVGLGETYALDTAVANYRYFALLGHPGAGKTTILEHLVCVCCDRTSEMSRYLPIYVPLRRCTFSDRSLIEQLTDATAGFLRSDLLKSYPAGFFESRMAKGQCIFLFDGLDEVLDEIHHVAAARMIESISLAFPDCPIIVSSRLAGWRDLLDSRFVRFVIRDLTPTAIEGLVRQWHRAVVLEEVRSSTEGSITASQETIALTLAREKAEDMVQILNATPRLLQIASTPLILSLMCLVYYTQHDLPRRRSRLYEECVVILLEEWDRRDKKMHHPDVPPLRDKLSLLEHIAMHYFDSNVTELRRQELVDVIDKFSGQRIAGSRAADVLTFIEYRSGILCEKARDVMAFTHLTLQEYLSACGLVASPNGFEKLMERYSSSEVQEVVLLYSGLATSSDNVVNALLMRYGETREPRYLITAGKSAVEAQAISARARENVIQVLVEAFDRSNDAQLLERLQSVLADLGITKDIVRSLGEFEIGRELGRGGFGTVYLATDKAKNVQIALKVYGVVREETFTKMLRGLSSLRHLRHPHLVRVLDFGKAGNQFFVAMEYVAGCTVDVFVRECKDTYFTVAPHQQDDPVDTYRRANGTKIRWNDDTHMLWVKKVICNVGSALEYLHERRVAHGDIKPGNISWDGTKATVLDVGVDAMMSEAKSRTQTASTGWPLFGTGAYMPPERINGGPATAQADIYSLGATMYFLVTGEHMFRAESFGELLAAARDRKPPSLRGRVGGQYEGLERVYQRMVEKNPKKRTQSIEAALRELRAVIRE